MSVNVSDNFQKAQKPQPIHGKFLPNGNVAAIKGHRDLQKNLI